jgi:hypothetical protein
MLKLAPALAILCLGLAGCSNNLYSVSHLDEHRGAEGVGYLLPARFVRLTVERVAVEEKDLKEAVTKAKAAVEATGAALKKSQEEVKEAKRLAEAAPAGPVKEKLAAAAIAAATVVKLREEDAKAAKDGLTLAEIKLGNAANKPKGSFEDRVTLRLDPAVGDPCYHFTASMRHDIASDDSWTLKTTAEGLLTSSDATSQSRVGDILVEFARLAGLGYGQTVGSSTVEKGRGVEYGPFKYERVFDVSGDEPACPAFVGLAKIESVNKELDALGTNVMIVPRAYAGAADATPAKQLQDYACPDKDKQGKKIERYCVPGLAYRRSIPYLIEVQSCPPKLSGPDEKCTKYISQSVVVAVPNRARIEVIPYDTAAFVTTKTKAEFADGMLTSAEATRPSELLEIVRTPGRMIEAAGKAIREVSPIQVDYTNRQSELAAAEAKFYEAQKKALDARIAYEKAKAEADAAP